MNEHNERVGNAGREGRSAPCVEAAVRSYGRGFRGGPLESAVDWGNHLAGDTEKQFEDYRAAVDRLFAGGGLDKYDYAWETLAIRVAECLRAGHTR